MRGEVGGGRPSVLDIRVAALAVALALTIGAGAVVVAGAGAGAAGRPHPERADLRIGGDGRARHGDLLVPIALAALGVAATATALLALGLPPGRRSTVIVAAELLLLAGSLAGMVAAYGVTMDVRRPPIATGLSVPLWWMLGAVWLAPVLVVVHYVLAFDRVIATREAEAFLDAARAGGADGT